MIDAKRDISYGCRPYTPDHAYVDHAFAQPINALLMFKSIAVIL
jgi:hypothetical protein